MDTIGTVLSGQATTVLGLLGAAIAFAVAVATVKFGPRLVKGLFR